MILAFIHSLVTHPKKWLLATFIPTLLLIYGITKIEADYSINAWLYPDNPKIIALRQHESDFGGSDTIDVIIHRKKGIFTPKIINLIQNITEDLWLIHGVERVQSLSNYNWVESNQDEINVEPFFSRDRQLDPPFLAKRKQQALSDYQLNNVFISSSANLVYIRCFLEVKEKGMPYEKIVSQAEKIINKYQGSDHTIRLSGISYINESLSRVSDRDLKLVFPIVILLLSFILFFFFKSTYSILFTFSLIGLTILSTFGITGHFHINFNNILAAMPAVLISVGLADAVHVLIAYRHNILIKSMNTKDAAIESLRKNFIPTILTTITTATGFFSLTLTSIKPIHDLGLLSGIGTIVAWLFTYFFLGPLLQIVRFPPRDNQTNEFSFSFLFYFCQKYRLWINTILPAFAILMVYFGLQNTVTADPVKYFSEDNIVRKNFNLIQQEFGGSRSIELVFDSNEEDGIKNPTFLKKSEALLEWVQKRDKVINASSLIQILKRLNQTLNGGDPNQYKLANNREEIAEQLFFYTLGLPEGTDLRNQMTDDYRKFKATILWDIEDSQAAINETKVIIDQAKKMDLNVYEGGQSPIYNQINQEVVKTFFASISLSLPVIFFIILIFFRDLQISFLSLIPNVFPLSIASGIMYLSGDKVNIGNVIVFSVCLGIAVDDTIHFLANYKIKMNSGESNENALLQTMAQTGRALILTTIMLCLGFGMFIFGQFVPNQKFGIYCAIILSLALLADLVLLPSILLSNKKKNIKNINN